MPRYEVGIYNERVRALLNEGLHHKDLDDDWEDTHYFEIVASDEAQARRKMEQTYPPQRGFVISVVEEMIDDD